MVLNDYKEDLKELCRRKELTQTALGEAMGLSRQVIDKRCANAGITKGYAEMVEALGYDIKLVYVKR